MAETAKVFNPDRKVLIPDLRAGCSLAESITAEALAERKAELRKIYPDLKVVSYVNCTADVKAESDACCTSANATKIIEAIDSNNILFVPDENLAGYVQSSTRKNIISWDGNARASSDHARGGDAGEALDPRDRGDCASRVPQGRDRARRRDALDFRDDEVCEGEPGGEVSHRDRVWPVRSAADGTPEKHFYKSCKLCRFMKMITLDGVLDALENLRYEITLDEEVREGANARWRRCWS